jgi:hypothetical protein
MAKYSGELFDAPPAVADSAPPPQVAAPASNLSMDEAFAKGTEDLKKDYEKKVEATTTSNLNIAGNEFSLPSFFTSPAGYVVGLGGAVLAGGAAAKYIPPAISKAKDITNRWLSSSAQNLSTLDTRVDPTMGTPASPSTVLSLDEARARMAGVTPAPVTTPVFNDPVFGTIEPEIDRNIPAYQRKGQPFAGTTPVAQPVAPLAPAMAPTPLAPAMAPTPLAPAMAPTPLAPAMAPVAAPSMAPVAPVTYVQPGQSFVTPLTVPETTPITSSAAPNSPATQAVTGLLTEEIKAAGAPETKVAGASVPETTVTQPVPPPAGAAQPPKKRGPAPAVPTGNYPTQQSFKSLKDIPEGFTFRPDVGNLDRSMYNILGPEHRQLAKEFLTGGQMFGQSADVNADVSKLTNQYFQRLQSEIPETILSRDARKMQGVPSDFGTFSSKGGFGKGVKVAGVAGTLFSLADIANAAQRGKITEAGMKTADLATDFIPLVSQIKAALSPPTVSSGTLDSPEARELFARAYAARVGGGRGIGVPPPR